MTRITALSSLMRISTRLERPTVSIQNGRPICLRISSDSTPSRMEKNGLGPGGGSGSPGRMSMSRPEPVGGDALQHRGLGVLRIALVDVDHRGDVGGDGRGQPARHGLVVALHEDIGDDRLQDHHRRDDDDERAGIEALGHQPAEPAQGAVEHRHRMLQDGAGRAALPATLPPFWPSPRRRPEGRHALGGAALGEAAWGRQPWGRPPWAAARIAAWASAWTSGWASPSRSPWTHASPLSGRREGGSRRRARSADRPDWPGPSRSCGAGG